MCSIEGAEAPSRLCFATDTYLLYDEEAKCRRDGCIGDRIPLQLWRGALCGRVDGQPDCLGISVEGGARRLTDRRHGRLRGVVALEVTGQDL